MGSGAWAGTTGGANHPVKGSGNRDSQRDGDSHSGGRRNGGTEARNGSGFRVDRPGSDGSEAAPQFLVEADDLFGGEYEESRLVAPPVIGEAPPTYRDF
ncbi:hypothetical protein [Haloactinomyces albus]|uniref:Uncharacterized protein n=1 Tax=Haloactinomyces albus TaxID=1352928 RepID=A0AAE3ZAY7_9ACTN|nr:hypothetical protein [Haloactinomyces albus]MDR7301578.1 hypothetical protein [Haloactinomyces albus]